jgi:Aminoglycoside adenylyltransferase, C-terminal domain/Nucleotidyltransferase domain
MPEPTPFEPLNEVLAELTAGASDALGSNMVGAYLVGSFVLGAGDEHSDVDFIVVTADPVTPEQEAGLRRMHAAFPERDNTWARHLEGSYPPLAEIRTLASIGRPWLYVDNGSAVMERSTHCNTAFVRSTLREHGIALAGPPPDTLVDPISADELRAEALRALEDYAAWVEGDPDPLHDAWNQPYVVTTFARILFTLATGEVTTKRAALQWARANLDARWRELIDAAIADRPDPWDRVGRPAHAERVAPTLAFVRYAAETGPALAR